MEAFYEFRELRDAHAIAALLRIRAQKFGEYHPGSEKPFGIDVTVHDQRARHFGVFRGTELVGGLRLAFRQEQQPSANIVRGIQALIAPPDPELAAILPSELAFNLREIGLISRLVDAEIGRLVLCRDLSCPGLLREVLVASLSVVHTYGIRYYLFSAAIKRYEQFADIARPRWRLTTPRTNGISGFDFPSPTHAGVATLSDCSVLERALLYADQLAANDVIRLAVSAESER